MQQCWVADPYERPDFDIILQAMIQGFSLSRVGSAVAAPESSANVLSGELARRVSVKRKASRVEIPIVDDSYVTVKTGSAGSRHLGSADSIHVDTLRPGTPDASLAATTANVSRVGETQVPPAFVTIPPSAEPFKGVLRQSSRDRVRPLSMTSARAATPPVSAPVSILVPEPSPAILAPEAQSLIAAALNWDSAKPSQEREQPQKEQQPQHASHHSDIVAEPLGSEVASLPETK